MKLPEKLIPIKVEIYYPDNSIFFIEGEEAEEFINHTWAENYKWKKKI